MGTQQADKLRKSLDRLVAVDASDDRQKQVDVAWGRRMLAQQMSGSGTFQDFEAALKVLEQNAVGGLSWPAKIWPFGCDYVAAVRTPPLGKGPSIG